MFNITTVFAILQVVIQVPQQEGQNILSKKDLLEHVTIMEQIANYNVKINGV